jgi:methionyl-tRNA synthetase
MKKFFITTPIYYINDVPHIGHTCTTVAADIIARLHKQLGEDVFFLTGTDEHGQKVAESAEKENLTPKDYCDKISPRFENAWKDLNIGFDFFIRTTDPRHEKSRKLYSRFPSIYTQNFERKKKRITSILSRKRNSSDDLLPSGFEKTKSILPRV